LFASFDGRARYVSRGLDIQPIAVLCRILSPAQKADAGGFSFWKSERFERAKEVAVMGVDGGGCQRCLDGCKKKKKRFLNM
jgi:hypothetical protein